MFPGSRDESTDWLQLRRDSTERPWRRFYEAGAEHEIYQVSRRVDRIRSTLGEHMVLF